MPSADATRASQRLMAKVPPPSLPPLSTKCPWRLLPVPLEVTPLCPSPLHCMSAWRANLPCPPLPKPPPPWGHADVLSWKDPHLDHADQLSSPQRAAQFSRKCFYVIRMQLSRYLQQLSTEHVLHGGMGIHGGELVHAQAMASVAAPEGSTALAPGDRVRTAVPSAAGWGAPANAPDAAVSPDCRGARGGGCHSTTCDPSEGAAASGHSSRRPASSSCAGLC